MQPKRKAFTLIEMLVVVAIIGILAALAIPSFMHLVRRSKTSEATMNLRRMYDGATTSYQADAATRTGIQAMVRFPDTVGASPAADSCCANGTGRCPANAASFDALTWQRLGFALDDPHFYWYSFASDGVGTLASFTARANGNLDCDLVFSTYERVGFVDLADGVTGGAAVYTNNPVE